MSTPSMSSFVRSSSDLLLPDERGYYGRFGGRYVAEILVPALEELEKATFDAMGDPQFWESYLKELREFSGRPTPITPLGRLSEGSPGVRFYLKREDLGQTGAHKVNNVIGQGMLARKMGKTRVIAETGAGQHGIATATMAARFGLKATIYMGAEDVDRQRPNVFWMEKLGAQVIPVEDGAKTLKDAINAAMRDWSQSFPDTHYLLGTACGPHPFPMLVSWLQRVIGLEARQQMLDLGVGLPRRVYACVGGGSNAIGLFQGFLRDEGVELIGVEAQGRGEKPGDHAARLAGSQGSMGIAQGMETYFLQNLDGQMLDTHSVAAGLDYVGVSPVIAYLAEQGRVRMTSAMDGEVLEAHRRLMSCEGVIGALESTHAVAASLREIAGLGVQGLLGEVTQSNQEPFNVLVNMSGRGDKDIFTIAEAFEDPSWWKFLQSKVDRHRKKNQ